MAAPKKKEAAYTPLDYVYVPLGVGQLIVEKAKGFPSAAVTLVKDRRKIALRTYRDLSGRGEKLVTSIRRGAATQRAVEQTRAARSRVKAAGTSVGKAVTTTVEATREAAKKVG